MVRLARVPLGSLALDKKVIKKGFTMTDNLSSGDYVGMSFWLISMALVAATAFFFVERDRVAGKWKTSLTVSGLVTLIAAVH